MLFSHEDIVFALSGNLNDPLFFAYVYNRLVENCPREADRQVLGDDYPDIFKLFLIEDLPASTDENVTTLDVVVKVVEKLTSFAEKQKFQIRNFYWWNIRPKLRALVATLTREGHVFKVYFYWKKTNKDEVHPMNRGCRTTCGLQPNTPGVLRLEFDAEAYQEMRAAYEHWLKSPLVLPQGFSKKTAEPSCPTDSCAPN
ncbi:MAG: hypothetical protein WC750_02655 [Patescibacteria group bacterium]|jgi:hypothetical protein